MQLFQERKTFSEFFAVLQKSRLNCKYFVKKDDPHSFYISEITNVVRQVSKKSIFKRSLNKQHGRCAQALLESVIQNLSHLHLSLPSQWSWEKSLLLTCKFLALLVNTLAADEKYPVLNIENLTLLIQMQLSQEQNTFSEFLTAFLKSRFNLKHFEKKMTLIEFVFPKLQTPKTWSEKCRESPVSEDLEKKHAKRAKALLKSLSQHLYYIH